MTALRPPRGVTLLELVTVVAIIAILAAISIAGLIPMVNGSRVTSTSAQLTAELAAARSHAFRRNTRVAVLINFDVKGGLPGESPVQFWTVVDPWYSLEEAMAARPDWNVPDDLEPPSPPAAAGEHFTELTHIRADRGVQGLTGGYAKIRGSVNPACSGSPYSLAAGSGGGGGYFAPPFCFVPDDSPCTFCGTKAPLRGAIVFDPEGGISLLASDGTIDARGAGSLAFIGANQVDAQGSAIAVTSAGLVRAFGRR